MINCFDIVIGKNPKILILGSIPGEKSLELKEYYAFKANRFWRILFEFFNKEYSTIYNDKLALLLNNNIALWDTIKYCKRENSSLDCKITNEVYNDIEKVIRENSSIKTIFFNGKKAENVYKRNFLGLNIKTVTLPSTSPANAGITYERLFTAWGNALKTYLEI